MITNIHPSWDSEFLVFCLIFSCWCNMHFFQTENFTPFSGIRKHFFSYVVVSGYNGASYNSLPENNGNICLEVCNCKTFLHKKKVGKVGRAWTYISYMKSNYICLISITTITTCKNRRLEVLWLTALLTIYKLYRCGQL